MEVTVYDHTEEILNALDEQASAALEAVGMQAVSYAKNTITEEGRVATGTLRNSISHLVVDADKTVHVGTNTSYAIYNEMGTGIHIGGGRQTPWSYQDAKGNWHRTSGMKPIHFLKNAVANHLEEYKAIIKQYLKK